MKSVHLCYFVFLFLSTLTVVTSHYDPEDRGHTTPGDCNICGCHDCYIYNELAVVKFYYPKTDLWYSNNCKTLRDQFSKNPKNMEPAWCWNELWTYTYAACGCAFPNGTLLSDVYDGRTEDERLRLPASYFQSENEDPETALQQAKLGNAQDIEPDQGAYAPVKVGHETIRIPEAKYFQGQPGAYENFQIMKDLHDGKTASSGRRTFALSHTGVTLLLTMCACMIFSLW